MWIVYMMEKQGRFKTEEEAKIRKEALEKTYKSTKLKFEVKEE